MTSWTALLESLHSAFVDELNDRFQRLKPELGMPLRQARFAVPHSEVAVLCFSEVFFGDLTGVALLALSAGSREEEIWSGMMKRAGAEFGRREIHPRFHAMKKMQVSSGAVSVPGLPEMQRVIWIPFRLPERAFYLGLGV